MTQYGSETILPYNKEEQKGTQVKRMFDSIAETMINSTILSHLVSTRYGAGKGSLSCVLSLLKRYWISLPVPETWLSPCTKSCDPTISSVPTSR